jgi:hypothetical protein
MGDTKLRAMSRLRALLVTLAVLATVLFAPSASAVVGSIAETRVGNFQQAGGLSLRRPWLLDAEKHQEKSAAFTTLASRRTVVGNSPLDFWDPYGLDGSPQNQSMNEQGWTPWQPYALHQSGSPAWADYNAYALESGVGGFLGQAWAQAKILGDEFVFIPAHNLPVHGAGLVQEIGRGWYNAARGYTRSRAENQASLGRLEGQVLGTAEGASVVAPALKPLKGVKGLKGASRIPDSAPVVRGGIATPEQIARGIGPHRDLPDVVGFSAQSRAGATVHELAATGGLGGKPFPHGKVSHTTAGELRRVGCDVLCTPGGGANHVTVVPGGTSPTIISELFDIIINPAR